MRVAVVAGRVVCGWFAACTLPARFAVEHPTLGWVPVCGVCNTTHDLAGTPATFTHEEVAS